MGILFLLVLLSACQNGGTTFTRLEDSPVIDRLLDSAPHLVVNTDIEPERWVATTRLGIQNDSLILGSPAYLLAVEDDIYVSELYGHDIFSIGNDGYLTRKVGSGGRAPGEFTYVQGMDYNGSHIFVKDTERIQIFTEDFEYVNSFFNSARATHRGFSVSPSYVFLECHEIDWLICPYSVSSPYSRIEFFKLLPLLDLADRTGENGNLVTVSPNGKYIAVAYMGLPYVFIYDNQFRHFKTIRFEGSDVDNFDPIAAPPGGADPRMEPGTRVFTITIKFIDSNYLIATTRRINNFIFDLSGNDSKLARKIIFSPINETKDIEPLDFALHDDYLYVSSPWEAYVYGYPFELNWSPDGF